MEDSEFEENDEHWLEKKSAAERRDSIRKIGSAKNQRRWRSVEEYQEWKKLRREIDDLDDF